MKIHLLAVIFGIIFLILLIILIIKLCIPCRQSEKYETTLQLKQWTPWYLNGIYPVGVKQIKHPILNKLMYYLCIPNTPPVADEIPTFFIQEFDTNGAKSTIQGHYQVICSYKNQLYYVGLEKLNQYTTFLCLWNDFQPYGFDVVTAQDGLFNLAPLSQELSTIFCMDLPSGTNQDYINCFCVFNNEIEVVQKIENINFIACFSQQYSVDTIIIFDGLYCSYAFNNSGTDQTLRYFGPGGDINQVVLHPGTSSSYFCAQDICLDNQASVQTLCAPCTDVIKTTPEISTNNINISWEYSYCDGGKSYILDKIPTSDITPISGIFFQVVQKCGSLYVGKLIVIDPNPNNKYTVNLNLEVVPSLSLLIPNNPYISVLNCSQNPLSWSFSNIVSNNVIIMPGVPPPAPLNPTKTLHTTHTINPYTELYIHMLTGNSLEEDENKFNLGKFLLDQVINLAIGMVDPTQFIIGELFIGVGKTVSIQILEDVYADAALQSGLKLAQPSVYANIIDPYLYPTIKQATTDVQQQLALKDLDENILNTTLVKSNQVSVDKLGGTMKAFLQRWASTLSGGITILQQQPIYTAYLCSLLLGNDTLSKMSDAFNEMIRTVPRSTVLKQIRTSRKINGVIADDKQIDLFILFQTSLLKITRLSSSD
jgi:hypothetical protein